MKNVQPPSRRPGANRLVGVCEDFEARIPAFPAVIGLVLAINLALMAVFVVQDPWNALIGFVFLAILWVLAKPFA